MEITGGFQKEKSCEDMETEQLLVISAFEGE